MILLCFANTLGWRDLGVPFDSPIPIYTPGWRVTMWSKDSIPPHPTGSEASAHWVPSSILLGVPFDSSVPIYTPG